MRTRFVLSLVFLVPALLVRGDEGQPLGKVSQSQVKVERWIVQLDLAPDGKSVVYSSGQDIYVVSFPDGKPVRTFPRDTPQDAPSGLLGVAFSTDGKKVIAVQPGIRVWELETGKKILSVDWDWMKKRPLAITPGAIPPPDPNLPRTFPVFAPDRKRVYVAGPGEAVTAWDIETGKEAARNETVRQQVQSMAVSPDGKYLAVGLLDGFQVWEAATLKKVFSKSLPAYKLERREAYRVSFHPNGKQVFVIGRSVSDWQGDDALGIWKLDKDKQDPVAQIRLRVTGYDRVLVLPGEKYGLLIASSRRVAALQAIDLKKGQLIGTMPFVGWNHPVLLTPDKKTFVTGGHETDLMGSLAVEDIQMAIENPLPLPPKNPRAPRKR